MSGEWIGGSNVEWIGNAIDEAVRHGDAARGNYRILADSFFTAHIAVPNGLSVEVGTRCGGSALLQLRLLSSLYGSESPPLITIDPYGDKPYLIGQNQCVQALYGNDAYVAAKRLLADFPNHLHFPITSLDWLGFAENGLRVWHKGRALAPAIDGLAHVFLDGDHDAKTIIGEVSGFLRMIRPGGCILIDNVDDDPATMDVLKSMAGVERPNPKMALIRKLP